jgi:hypothetical protein
MKKNTKNLILYIGILFSFALVLILFAGLTQNNYAKELAESQGIKQNLVEITEQYQTLTDSMKVLNEELSASNTKIEELEKEIETLTSRDDASTKIMEAYRLFEKGRRTEAKEKIAEIDKELLTQEQLYIYNKITK